MGDFSREDGCERILIMISQKRGSKGLRAVRHQEIKLPRRGRKIQQQDQGKTIYTGHRPLYKGRKKTQEISMVWGTGK